MSRQASNKLERLHADYGLSNSVGVLSKKRRANIPFSRDRRANVLLILLAAGLALAACTSGVATRATTTSEPQAEPTLAVVRIPTATPEVAEELGLEQQVYVSAGCSACHGQNGEGSEIAPALGGHSALQVKRQARAPVGLMPPFPPDQLSDADLEAIVQYITGLDTEHGHQRTSGSGGELVMHHWMALFSLEDEQATESLHHIGHILDLVEGAHLAAMRETEAMVNDGEFHDASHIVEGMLSGLDTSVLDESRMHLTLTLSALRIDETDESLHHLSHYLGLVKGHELEQGEDLEALIGAGDLGAADSVLEQLIGVEADDHGAEEAGHDEAEADEAGHEE